MEKAHEAWDTAVTVIDEARKKQMAAPGLQEPAKKALATLDREWDGLPRTGTTRWSAWTIMRPNARSAGLS